MHKVVFAYPDFENLGTEYLLAVAQECGYETDFVFYNANDPYLGSGEQDVDYEELAQSIVNKNPDLVGFSCVTDNFRYQLKLAQNIKKVNPAIKTIFGGVHISAVPKIVLEHDAVDAIGIGESEEAFKSFLQACSSTGNFDFPDESILGIVYKKNGERIGEYKEGPLGLLDELPFPDKQAYFNHLKEIVYDYRIIATRGCPYRCTFCFNSQYFDMRGDKVIIRNRSVDNIFDELKLAIEKFDIPYVLFVDDSFTTKHSWLKEFCERYPKEIGLPFSVTANPHYITKEKVQWLADAGCINMQIGVQTLSEDISWRVVKRWSKNEHIAQAITELTKAGIMVQVDHIFGLPEDTVEIQEQNVLFYNQYRPDLISTFWLSYYPGTKVIDTAKEMGMLTDEDIQKINNGEPLNSESYLTGGDIQNPQQFYALAFLLNWLPLLPKFLVSFLLTTKLYKILRIKNYYVSIALPRFIMSITNKKYFRGRNHIRRFFGRIKHQLTKVPYKLKKQSSR